MSRPTATQHERIQRDHAARYAAVERMAARDEAASLAADLLDVLDSQAIAAELGETPCPEVFADRVVARIAAKVRAARKSA